MLHHGVGHVRLARHSKQSGSCIVRGETDHGGLAWKPGGGADGRVREERESEVSLIDNEREMDEARVDWRRWDDFAAPGPPMTCRCDGGYMVV